MLISLIALAGAVAAAGFVQAAVWRRLLRAFERERAAAQAERAELLNRIMYLADKPWAAPPDPGEVLPMVSADWNEYSWPEQAIDG